MKKKILISISTVMVLIVCAIALVACAPTTVPEYVAKLVKADKWTMEMTDGETILFQRNGNIVYQKVSIGGETGIEGYFVKEVDKYFIYQIVYKEGFSSLDDVELNKWTREEAPAEYATKIYSYPTMLFEDALLNNSEEKLVDFDEETIIERFKNKFGEEDKKWYPKNENGALDKTDAYTLNKGKLEIYMPDQSGNMILSGTMELKAPKLALPAEAAKLKP